MKKEHNFRQSSGVKCSGAKNYIYKKCFCPQFSFIPKQIVGSKNVKKKDFVSRKIIFV